MSLSDPHPSPVSVVFTSSRARIICPPPHGTSLFHTHHLHYCLLIGILVFSLALLWSILHPAATVTVLKLKSCQASVQNFFLSLPSWLKKEPNSNHSPQTLCELALDTSDLFPTLQPPPHTIPCSLLWLNWPLRSLSSTPTKSSPQDLCTCCLRYLCSDICIAQ